MKKILAFMLILIMCLTATSCGMLGKSDDNSKNDVDSKVDEPFELSKTAFENSYEAYTIIDTMAQDILLTSQGLKDLEAELEDLKVRGRQEIKEKIQVALSFGDLSENSEYEEARNDQGKLEARISEIEGILSMAKIIDEDALSTDIIQMGSKVTIKDIEYGDIYKYQIISSTSTSKDKGVDYLTSDESPVAKAPIGHAAGDIVEVEAPIGIIKYEVIEITK